MRILLLILSLSLLILPASGRTAAIRTGLHSFTIQWIGYNKAKPGAATVKSLGKGRYSIEGAQKDNKTNDYVTISGTFSVEGRELRFEGKIISRISFLNNGAPCERTGPQVFRASGARKYWRLQQMLNCDGETTDYIDIFF